MTAITLALLAIVPFLPAWNGAPIFDDEFIGQDPYFRFPRSERRAHYPSRFLFPRSIVRWTHGATSAIGRQADHAFNIGIHVLNVALVYALGIHFAPAAAFAIAAVFAVHPLQVSSVAYTAARAGVLSFFFALLVVAGFTFLPEGPLWIFPLLLCWLGYKSKEDFPCYLAGMSAAALWCTWR